MWIDRWNWYTNKKKARFREFYPKLDKDFLGYSQKDDLKEACIIFSTSISKRYTIRQVQDYLETSYNDLKMKALVKNIMKRDPVNDGDEVTVKR